MSVITLSYKVEGFLKIYDPNSGEVLVDKHNAINYENMSEAIADTLSHRGYGEIYQMAFGNGGASVDETGGFYFSSHLKITDPNTKEVLVQKRGDN